MTSSELWKESVKSAQGGGGWQGSEAELRQIVEAHNNKTLKWRSKTYLPRIVQQYFLSALRRALVRSDRI